MSAKQHRIRVQQLHAGYLENKILSDITIDIPDGSITALIGANGCGKSTLLKTIARFLDPTEGTVVLDGKEITDYSRRGLAQLLAVLPQSPIAPEGLSVRELVRFGRHPHRRLLSRTDDDDERIIDAALNEAGMRELADRDVEQLSGGQRQRAWIAMALAQDTGILLLDEPTTYLDITHQHEVLRLLRSLNRNQGRTIIMVLHDLNQAARFADHIIALADGGVVAVGSPEEVITVETIREVFDLECAIIDNPLDGTPLCLTIDD
ncbi:iron ABC transport system ATP-binding protein [Corynebacterium kutscheri]|uniref:ABC transporter ATP-binding protein n=1 Tax=Corynebacterium kutscheri TaxID=35755 RepID=UPI000F6E69F3|nr:ABC transporter ATP-binding protein [Corynebacterium kutscheri]VEH80038.1 iron ABC transport system ATP-binding protein [Corynebacterium kutscheri]